MIIIDAHAHLFDFPGYLEKLLQTMDETGIEKCCISGLGKMFMCVDNNGVKKAFVKYPNRIIGAYFVRPGKTKPSDIQTAYDDGFKMIKVTIPLKPYDHHSFFPLWEITQELDLPILFHTGLITVPKLNPNENISSWYMHPMRIEPITNAFPNLKIIIAHLGVHWNEDASELIRMRHNVYADLTGAPEGWRARVDKVGIKKWLWWPNAFKKIIFGTDVIFNKIPIIITQDKARYDRYKIDQKTQELIFSKNILKLLGEK